MAAQQQKHQPDLQKKPMNKRLHRTRWLIASIVFLFVAVGASIWLFTNQNALTTVLPLIIFTTLGVLIALLQWLFPLTPTHVEHISEGLQTIHQAQSTITSISPGQPLLETAALPSYRRIIGFPPLTDSRSIQQRESVVKAVYSQLMQNNITALVLTGIGGVGKSTLASLIYRYVEEQRAAHTTLFLSETLWLTIDSTVTFADLIGNLFEALGKPIPQLNNLAPHNQAATLFNALNTADKPRLIIFDQFENLLNWETGRALADRPGVGEWLDIINSQQCACRFLLTSRPRPMGVHEYPLTYLQEYPVGSLEIAEGVALLRNRGVAGTEEELQAAVTHCEGHALSLSLLASLIRDHTLNLTLLLKDPTLWIGNIAQNLLDHIYSKQLNDLQRALLLAFSVYREPVVLEAAEAIIADRSSKLQILDALNALRIQHLIEPTGEGHYQLHAIIAEYAYGHFDEHNELANKEARKATHLRAAQYYQQRAGKSCLPPDKRRNVRDIHDFIEAIWHHCQAEQWQEAYNLIEQEKIFSHLRQWGNNAMLLELCLMIQPQGNWFPKPVQAGTIYRYMAWAYNALGKEKWARENNEKALQLYVEGEDLKGQENILDALGWSYYRLGQIAQAVEYYKRTLDICRKRGNRRGEGHVLNGLGRVYIQQGQRKQALGYFEQALAICKEEEDAQLVLLC